MRGMHIPSIPEALSSRGDAIGTDSGSCAIIIAGVGRGRIEVGIVLQEGRREGEGNELTWTGEEE